KDDLQDENTRTQQLNSQQEAQINILKRKIATHSITSYADGTNNILSSSYIFTKEKMVQVF
ncbi:MAG: hypothetical protein MHPSP_000064, partial [Paramarteilia canceri]